MPVADLLGSKVYTRIRGVRSRQGKLIWTSSVYSEAQTLGIGHNHLTLSGIRRKRNAIRPRTRRASRRADLGFHIAPCSAAATAVAVTGFRAVCYRTTCDNWPVLPSLLQTIHGSARTPSPCGVNSTAHGRTARVIVSRCLVRAAALPCHRGDGTSAALLPCRGFRNQQRRSRRVPPPGATRRTGAPRRGSHGRHQSFEKRPKLCD